MKVWLDLATRRRNLATSASPFTLLTTAARRSVGAVPREMSTRRRVEGAAAALDALADTKKNAPRVKNYFFLACLRRPVPQNVGIPNSRKPYT